MRRRDLLITAAAALAAPRIGRAASASTLRFIPQSDLTILDPHWTTAYVTRNHGYLVFDTLYGTDGQFRPSPQMVAGHVVEDGGLRWTLTLRDGLLWHDGTPVLARDCVASIRRWGQRDASGRRCWRRPTNWPRRTTSVSSSASSTRSRFSRPRSAKARPRCRR